MALTEQDVFDASEKIRESGRVPSAITIREITQVGSLGTIQKHLRKWRHRETVSSSCINPPPEQVLNSIRQFGEQLWQLALQQAEKAASIKVRQAREEQEEAQRDTDEVMLQIEGLQEQLRENQAKLQAEHEGKLKIEHLNETLRQEQGVLKDEVSQEKYRAERLQDQLKGLEEKNISLKNDLEELRDKWMGAEGMLRENQKILTIMQKDEAVLKSQLLNLTSLNNSLTLENKELKLNKDALFQRVQKQDHELARASSLERDLAEAQQTTQKIQAELRQFSIDLDSEKQVNRRLENLLNRLQPSVLAT